MKKKVKLKELNVNSFLTSIKTNAVVGGTGRLESLGECSESWCLPETHTQ